MLEIEIDGKKLTVPDGSTVIEAAQSNGTYIPHFCYHKKLSIAANCRMCLVQVEKAPKPLPACATPVTDGMKVTTHSDMAVKAQKGVMEFLLINHPLDCPICDQGGECQLQDLAVGYGNSTARYEEDKRVVSNKDLGPLIATDMTRCIHCTRCVRFTDEVAGLQEMGMAGRGEHSEIMSFIGMTVNSEISGNVIDLCPVGALTSKPFRYSARTWELSRRKSVSPHDGLGTNIIVQVKQDRVMRVLPIEDETINECWISDRDRFSYEALNSEQRLTRPMLKQDGKWLETDWQTALEYIANGLKSIVAEYGPKSIGSVATPHSTFEELYLLNKIALGLGAESAQFSPRVSDNNLSQSQHGVNWLGQSIADLLASKVVLVVGSNIRKEQPILAQRLRQATKRRLKLALINCHNDDLLCNVSARSIVRPDQLVEALAGILNAVVVLKSGALSEEHSTADSNFQRIAQLLLDARTDNGRSSLVLGSLVLHHPRASELAYLANQIAELTGATLGWLSEGANTVGAQVAGLLQSSSALTMPHKAFLLLNVEPELDGFNGTEALAHIKAADMVVAMSPFKHAAQDYADVMLPLAPFTETPGSFLSMEAKLHKFNAVVKPLGDARQGWKVLRVLGKLLQLDGFEFDTIDAVRNAALPQGEPSIVEKLNNQVSAREIPIRPVSTTLVRLAEVPIYQSDAIVRRAASLQKTNDALVTRVSMSDLTIKGLGISEGDNVSIEHASGKAELLVAVDDGLPEGVVRLPFGHPLTASLGNPYEPITVSRAERVQ